MFRKTITTYLKAKNSLHATRISSLKYVFIVFFEKKTDAKIYMYIKVTQSQNLALFSFYIFFVYDKILLLHFYDCWKYEEWNISFYRMSFHATFTLPTNWLLFKVKLRYMIFFLNPYFSPKYFWGIKKYFEYLLLITN